MSDDWPTEPQKRLAEYAQAYIAEFNAHRTELERLGPPASLYAKEIVTASIFAASDGFAIVYVDEETRTRGEQVPDEVPKGVSLYDSADETLTHLMQSMSGDLIKITQRTAGDSIHLRPSLPPDIPKEDRLPGINPKVLEPYLGRPEGGLSLTGIAIGPQWKFENGVCVHPLPTRWRVFTPFIPVIPTNEPRLQFIYPFVDLIWGQQELGLNAEAGKLFAQADIEVLLLGIAAGIPPQQLAQDPFEAVAAHCERACDELFALVDDPNTDEKPVQKFLEQPGHRFLVSPHSTNIIPQKTLAGLRFKIDFAVQRSDNDYHLVEIESPNTRIYQEKGEEPTAPFTHAIQQVEDWFRYIDEHRSTVRAEDGMPTIYKPTGEVVIGRDKHMGDTARKRFDHKRGESHRITLKTYDMMIAEGRTYASSLRRMRGTSQS